MARMPGRVAQPWCPVCNGPPGLDCPEKFLSPRQVRRRLARDLQDEIKEARDEQH